MKKVVYLFIIVAIIASCKTKGSQFVIKAKIAGAENSTFVLQERAGNKYIILDSAIVKKGQFTMRGVIDYPKIVVLMDREKRKGLSFYLENSEISITGHVDSLNKAKISGSKTYDDYLAYQTAILLFNNRNAKLNQDYKAAEAAGDKSKMTELEKGSEQIYNEKTVFNREFIKNHLTSYIIPDLLYSISSDLDVNELDSILNSLDPNISGIQTIKDLKEHVAMMKIVDVGKKAPDFTLNDVNDKPVALSSRIGKSKLLLVDFWAAWCGPCRNENPNVVKVYKEFNKKGFDIFSVSLDRTKEDWVKAIAEDKLTWTHVSDLQYWNCAAAKLYAVNAIPANFLLDEKGTIIARNLRGNNLYDKVNEVLGGK